MRGSRSLGLALIAAALGAAPALSQQQNAPAPPGKSAQANVAPAPGANMPNNANTTNNAAPANNANTANNATMGNSANNQGAMANNAEGPSGALQKYNDEWRTSKLVGATVYDSSGQDIGTVDDLLMGDDGKVTQAIVSTGGGAFGIGAKLVAVPIDQFKFEPSAGNNRAAGATGGAPNAPVKSNGSTTTAANQSPPHPTNYSLVLPGATKDSLSKQQTFKYASTD